MNRQKKPVYLLFYTHQQKKRREKNPASLKVKQHFAAPGRAMTNHVNDVLTELINAWCKKKKERKKRAIH